MTLHNVCACVANDSLAEPSIRNNPCLIGLPSAGVVYFSWLASVIVFFPTRLLCAPLVDRSISLVDRCMLP